MEHSLHHLVMVWEDAFLKALDFFERNNKVILVDPDADRLSFTEVCSPSCLMTMFWSFTLIVVSLASTEAGVLLLLVSAI